MYEIAVQTNSRTDFIDITDAIRHFVQEQNIQDGIVTVFIPHTTAGVTINENADPDVTADMEMVLDQVIPWTNGYAHMEGNTAAHVKASMMGSSTQVLVENGTLIEIIVLDSNDVPLSKGPGLKLLKLLYETIKADLADVE